MPRSKRGWIILAALGLLAGSIIAPAAASEKYRLLSISDSEKLILVSLIPGKTKYLLDASSAKIMLNDKAAEFKELQQFSIIQVKMNLQKIRKNGIDLDGAAQEIRITAPEKEK